LILKDSPLPQLAQPQQCPSAEPKKQPQSEWEWLDPFMVIPWSFFAYRSKQMKTYLKIFCTAGLLALASCADLSNTKPNTTASTPPPPRQTIRKPLQIQTEPAGAIIIVDGINFGYSPVDLTFPAYADTGEFIEPHWVEAIPTQPGQYTQQGWMFIQPNWSGYTLYMYNTAR
jgi:hypothetical protein